MAEPKPIRHAGHVEDAVEAFLRLWEETELARVERDEGLAPRSLPTARSWNAGQVFDWQAADHLPGVYVVGGKLAPVERRRGGLTGTQEITVMVVCEGQAHADSARQAKRLLTAYKTALIEHPNLGGVASDVRWNGDTHDNLKKQARRATAAQAAFTIHIPLGPYVIGPAEPPVNPYDDPPGEVLVTETVLAVEPTEAA